jgi:hypothetical protein
MSKTKKTPKIPLAERRGLQGPFQVDLSFFALLVQAGIDKVAGCFAREMKARRHKEDVGRADLPDCDVFGNVYFPFQLRGHSWTTVIHRIDDKLMFSPQLAKRLSAQLKTKAIFAGDHDTGGTTDYIMYDGGKLAEVFHWHDMDPFHTLTPAEIAKVEREPFGGVPFGYYGASRARKLPLADFKALEQGVDFYPCVERLFDGFLKSQDAFLAFNLMDEPGTEYFPIAEATDEDIVRIDVIET